MDDFKKFLDLVMTAIFDEFSNFSYSGYIQMFN